MSQLQLAADCHVSDEPQIFSFVAFASQRNRVREFIPSDERARTEFHNRSCPICSRVTVEPIELHNGLLGRNGKLVPGTGTLVGFSCNACGHEWPV